MISNRDAEEILKHEYHLDNFTYLVKELLLPDFTSSKHDVHFNNEIFQSVTQLGESSVCDLTVFEVYLNEGTQNKRVTITQEMFKILRSLRIDNAIVSFVNQDKNNYRISLLTSKYEYDGDKIVRILSNPRRFSYSLGFGTKTKTAYKYLISKGKVNSLEELTERFSVEVVNKQFYNEIALCYTKLVGGERDGKKFDKQLGLYSVVDQKKYAEFAVRLIGRITFCWFLKEKKSAKGISLIPEELLSIDTINNQDNYYHKTLEPLFFELLNTNQKKRKDKYATDEYKQIPYLNGGLFSPHSDDLYKYDSLAQCGKYGLVNIPNEWFKEFYDVLSQYNFTVDENTSYDIELSIDPEMLGRIFENLLAEINPETGENAKKSTGSFYTPRDIVDYMVDSSLCEYLKNKTDIDEARLKALISYGKEDDSIASFDYAEKKNIIDALYTITVLDPACGSGAFPIGMLQKIVYILQEVDPGADLWFDKATENFNDIFLKKEFEKKFKVGDLNYIRKLKVIQNSIFGIDIQPIAVEISRLRCFLSLVIEETVNDEEYNRGINPLPNLDFKFIIANSLLQLPQDSDINKTVSDNQLSIFEDQEHIIDLKRVRDEYFGTNDSETKKDLISEFKDIQHEMLLKTISNYNKKSSERYQNLSAWKPFSNESTNWFDPDWMFGIKDGFDIVIGNPPYISAVNNSKTDKGERELIRKIYPELKGAYDLYAAFLSFGVKQIKGDGIYIWIVPNKLLVSKYAQDLMIYLIKNGLINSISISHIEVFDNVGVYPIIVKGNKKYTNQYEELNVETLEDLKCEKFKQSVNLKAYKKFKDFDIKFSSGATGFQAQQLKDYISDDFVEEGIPFVVSGSIDRYSINYNNVRYMGKTYNKPYVIKGENIADSKWKFWNSEKIIIAGMTKCIESVYVQQPTAMGVGIYAICSYGKFNPKFLCALLNSKFLSYYMINKFKEKHLAGGYLAINKSTLEELPLIDANIETQNKLADLYDKIITNTENNKDYQNEIDRIVYDIYELSPDEIQEVEKF